MECERLRSVYDYLPTYLTSACPGRVERSVDVESALEATSSLLSILALVSTMDANCV